MERALREKNLSQVLESIAASVTLVYNPKLWDSWTMQQYASLPLVNFYDYSGELEK